MNIGIIGMGFVGGTTAKVLSKEHKIFPYDKYKEDYNHKDCIMDLAEKAEVAFICVPTPMQKSGAIDYFPIHNSITNLISACGEVRRNPEEILVTIRSTAVSGTTDRLAEKYPFKFAFNPEFLREKYALQDMENTDRVVLGVEDGDGKSLDKLLGVYKPLFPNASYYIVNRGTAEMIKYSANVMLATQIAAANMLYKICKAVDVNYDEVKKAILHDPRIGRNLDVPGHDGKFGFGGKCFPKDLNALIYLAREHMVRPYLFEEVWRLNKEVREEEDWLDIPGAVSENKNFSQKS